MALPSKLHFLGLDYPIIEETQHTAKEGVVGEVDFVDQVIYIHKHLPEELKIETLLHECIHIVDRAFNLDLEESQVKRLSFGLYGFLKDSGIARMIGDKRAKNGSPARPAGKGRRTKTVPEHNGTGS